MDSLKVVLAISQDASKHGGKDAPDTEFLRMARLLDAPVVSNTGHTRSRLLQRVEKATALDIGQATAILRDYPDADVYVSFSERVGIPLGFALARRKNRPAHIMIAHRLDTKAKAVMASLGRWDSGIDRIITLCSAQHKYAVQRLPDKCVMILSGITDDRFYKPPGQIEEEDYILSVGSENRDYETLAQASAKAGYDVRVLSSSPWCRKKVAGGSGFEHVNFLPRLDFYALREQYWKSKMIVVPLNDVEYAAGLNAVLEAWCVDKPVIVSASRGIIDYIDHKQNAYVVPVGDADAMAEAIETLRQSVELRERLREGARRAVSEYANLDTYVNTLISEIRGVAGASHSD